MLSLYLPQSPRQIKYSETDLSGISAYPVRIDAGVYISVISGHATLNTGAESFALQPRMELSFNSGGIFQLADGTPDFRVRMMTYTRDLFLKVVLPMDRIFVEYSEERPVYVHTADERSQRTWREAQLWMDMARTLFGDGAVLRFPSLQEEAYLQGFWMWVFGTIQDRLDRHAGFSNTQLIAHRFMRMVKAEAKEHHDVAYYAGRLNISQRYLNKTITRHTFGRTPKQIIDAHLVAEIKERLMDATLSVTQIARGLNFPDQSYLSRFFRRHTGQSPLHYRSAYHPD